MTLLIVAALLAWGLLSLLLAPLHALQRRLAQARGLRTNWPRWPALPKWTGTEAPFHIVPRLAEAQTKQALSDALVMWGRSWRWDNTGELFTVHEILDVACAYQRDAEQYPWFEKQILRSRMEIAHSAGEWSAFRAHSQRFWFRGAVVGLLVCEALAVWISQIADPRMHLSYFVRNADGIVQKRPCAKINWDDLCWAHSSVQHQIMRGLLLGFPGWIVLVLAGVVLSRGRHGKPPSEFQTVTSAPTDDQEEFEPETKDLRNLREQYAHGAISLDEFGERTGEVLQDASTAPAPPTG